MTIDREKLAEIKKRHEHTAACLSMYGRSHELDGESAVEDRAALLDALEAAEAREKRMREALKHYMEQHCEAYSDCGAADITDGDCHGCVAKRALAETAQ